MERLPLIHNKNDLKIRKDNLHHINVWTFSHFSSVLFAIFWEICLCNMKVSGPSPLVKEKSNGGGGGVPCYKYTILLLQALFFSFSCFFRIVNGKCFFEQALVFVKRMSKKEFCRWLHTPRTLISGLALSPVKPFTTSLSFFIVLVQLQHRLKLFLVILPQNLEHYCVSLLWNRLFCSSLHELRHNFDHPHRHRLGIPFNVLL